MVHVVFDLARHVGHADILRQQINGAAGFRAEFSNLPENLDWPALRRQADRARWPLLSVTRQVDPTRFQHQHS
jgi:hypothetical protein